MINIQIYKDYVKALAKLYRKGGNSKDKAEKAEKIVRELEDGTRDIGSLQFRQETRIEKFKKIELDRDWRIVMVHVVQDIIAICFVGNHDDTDEWCNKNRGLTLKYKIEEDKPYPRAVYTSTDSEDGQLSGDSTDQKKPLSKMLSNDQYDDLVEGVKPSLITELATLTPHNEEWEIRKITEQIINTEQGKAIYDVFCLLRQGRQQNACDRIYLYLNKLTAPEDLTEEQKNNISSNEHFLVGESDRAKRIMEAGTFMEWMLYLHPDQRALVDQNFPKSAQLIGVSGSGKTCIIIHRALRLSEKYPGEKILIVTLNRALAQLIKNLLEALEPEQEKRKHIEVKAFFVLCQEYLRKWEPENADLYDDKTVEKPHYASEHIDEVWQEFYRCEANNTDAQILIPLHDSLISRTSGGIDAQEYIREEFDWLRSSFSKQDRSKYAEDEPLPRRTNRTHPLSKDFRKMITQGLAKWEEKMEAIGVIDYLGLSVALQQHSDKMQPEYRCVLVDEFQDFGTTELTLLRKLVAEGENDLLLSGDETQKISYKNQSLSKAGVEMHNTRIKKIYKNYRNSREILEFSSAVFHKNKPVEGTEDREFLNPEYAERTGAVPAVLKAGSLSEEISYAHQYLTEQTQAYEGKKGCIAMCDFSLRRVQRYAEQVKIPALDGTKDIKDAGEAIYLSDLEQLKGFEFDYICIVNCNHGIMPDPTKPKGGEQMVDLTRLYVAMTRAKLELVISHSGKPSEYIEKVEHCKSSMDDLLYQSEDWSEYVDSPPTRIFPCPSGIDAPKGSDDAGVLAQQTQYRKLEQLSGAEFLYRSEAVGLSADLVKKLRELVDGTGRTQRDGDKETRTKWKNMGGLMRDLGNCASARKAMGKDENELITRSASWV